MIKALLIGIATLFPLLAAAQETELLLFHPFDSSSAVATTLNGQCWQQSQRSKREDAWRCQADGRVLDPCFVRMSGDHKQALCIASPWSGERVLLTVSDALDNSRNSNLDMSRGYPWALETRQGDHCLAVDDGLVFDNLPVRYQCDGQIRLLGHLQRCRSEWSILRRDSEGQIAATSIDKAWF